MTQIMANSSRQIATSSICGRQFLRAVHEIAHLIFTKIDKQNKNHYYLHFTDREMKTVLRNWPGSQRAGPMWT